MRLKQIKIKLAENNYKLTPQRTAILNVLLNNQSRHLTAEEVFVEARKEMPNIGIATVYRTLDKLASMDILYKAMFDKDKYRYELSDYGNNQHLHVICLGCNRIIEFDDEVLNHLEAELESEGYKIVDREIKIFGYCPACNKLDK